MTKKEKFSVWLPKNPDFVEDQTSHTLHMLIERIIPTVAFVAMFVTMVASIACNDEYESEQALLRPMVCSQQSRAQNAQL